MLHIVPVSLSSNLLTQIRSNQINVSFTSIVVEKQNKISALIFVILYEADKKELISDIVTPSIELKIIILVNLYGNMLSTISLFNSPKIIACSGKGKRYNAARLPCALKVNVKQILHEHLSELPADS